MAHHRAELTDGTPRCSRCDPKRASVTVTVSRVGDETIRNFAVGPSSDPLLGLVVDSYKIESQVGSGAMGVVYRGVHTVIGKAAAIKVLKADYADDPDMVQRLIREARSVNAIRHPAIVDIFGFGTLPRTGQPYIVMDLLEGQPLDQFIAEHGPVPPRDALPLIDELLGALAAAHQVGVIHRDLKPGNVFVEDKPDGKRAVKVIDFGLARQADRAGGSVRPTNPGTLLGTPAFMAPEQVLGTKVSPETDLYAVGGIAYQMLTNHLPHEAPSAIEVLSQKMKHDPIRPKQWQPQLADELDAWVMKLLAREVEDRYPSATEARSALKALWARRTASGASPRHKPGGVVPKRGWSDAKTVLTEPMSEEKAAEVSTNRHLSPFAPAESPRAQLTSTLDEPSPVRPPEPTLLGEAASKVPTEPGAPPLPEVTDPEVGVVPPPSAPPQLRPPTTDVAPPPAKTGLYVALALALLALIGGLLWLISLTPA